MRNIFSNDVFHWLGANLEYALDYVCLPVQADIYGYDWRLMLWEINFLIFPCDRFIFISLFLPFCHYHFVAHLPIETEWHTHIYIYICALVNQPLLFWTNAWIWLIGPLRTNIGEILIGIHTFSLKKLHLKISSAKWHPLCLGFNVLREGKAPVAPGWRPHGDCTACKKNSKWRGARSGIS